MDTFLSHLNGFVWKCSCVSGWKWMCFWCSIDCDVFRRNPLKAPPSVRERSLRSLTFQWKLKQKKSRKRHLFFDDRNCGVSDVQQDGGPVLFPCRGHQTVYRSIDHVHSWNKPNPVTSHRLQPQMKRLRDFLRRCFENEAYCENKCYLSVSVPTSFPGKARGSCVVGQSLASETLLRKHTDETHDPIISQKGSFVSPSEPTL